MSISVQKVHFKSVGVTLHSWAAGIVLSRADKALRRTLGHRAWQFLALTVVSWTLGVSSILFRSFLLSLTSLPMCPQPVSRSKDVHATDPERSHLGGAVGGKGYFPL